MRKLVWLLIAAGAFYAHSRFVFSESRLMGWLAKQQNAAMQGDPKLCDRLDDDFTAEIIVSMPGRPAKEESHSKSDYCESMRDMAAALRVMGGSLSTTRNVQQVKVSSFPWLRAEAIVEEETVMTAGRGGRQGSMTTTGETRYVFRRGLNGLHLVSLKAEGEMSLGR